ncbi:hypothetical protein OAN307_c15420 [Octadecabacter antarcticus 307]|uniref:Histidine kinase n=1 Tax=Octadecabacter antarcticus 307 TaxID=391626 RepID=M9RBK8_9RHOB|nr:DUF6446 family protein [Octadecabacter antarcticus]AGI67215.1 hypothetical protein OAN307_c15420 [Octadecabacter antarcticus 307]
MNATRFAIVFIVGFSIFGGALMYYQLEYAGYVELTPAEVGEIQLINIISGNPEAILSENVEAIDSLVDGVRLSSSVSYRACFETPRNQTMLAETYVIMDDAVPWTAPSWFDCFDAREVGKALEDGDAIAFISQENINFGIDRVVAILPDGRGFVWHQPNPCGEAVFSGDPTPDGCPDLPEDF